MDDDIPLFRQTCGPLRQATGLPGPAGNDVAFRTVRQSGTRGKGGRFPETGMQREFRVAPLFEPLIETVKKAAHFPGLAISKHHVPQNPEPLLGARDRLHAPWKVPIALLEQKDRQTSPDLDRGRRATAGGASRRTAMFEPTSLGTPPAGGTPTLCPGWRVNPWPSSTRAKDRKLIPFRPRTAPTAAAASSRSSARARCASHASSGTASSSRKATMSPADPFTPRLRALERCALSKRRSSMADSRRCPGSASTPALSATTTVLKPRWDW